MPDELDDDEELELDDEVDELEELLDELLLLDEDELEGESSPPHADKAVMTKTVPASRKQPAGNKAAEIFMSPPELIFFMK